MSQVKITMQLTDGYSHAVSIERTLALPKPDQPEYGEPGYNSNRKYPAVDWADARIEAGTLIEEMRAEFMDRLVGHGEKEDAKAARVNRAKGIQPLEAQRVADELSQAVDTAAA